MGRQKLALVEFEGDGKGSKSQWFVGEIAKESGDWCEVRWWNMNQKHHYKPSWTDPKNGKEIFQRSTKISRPGQGVHYSADHEGARVRLFVTEESS